ncbi:hypothetical protein [Myroides sp. TSA_177.3]|uniref:hypothetical protein n=1 Tax=Myroides sp. TSA_177.3 TaxID=3415650 RepID=UPI0040455A85
MKKSLVLFAFLFLLTGGAMLAHTTEQLTTEAVEKSYDPTKPYGYTIFIKELSTGNLVYEETFCAIEADLPAIYQRILEPFGEDMLDFYQISMRDNGRCN